MLNEGTRKRLLAICTKVSKNQSVSDFDLTWAQKNAIHDEEAANLLKKGKKFIPAEVQIEEAQSA
jgi:hypothetical protein